MILTNKLGLPEPFVKAVNRLNPPRDPKSGIISVTTLIRPPQMVALERKHWHEIEEDVSDRVWTMGGALSHLVLEAAAHGMALETEGEIVLETGKTKVVGHYDLYLEDSATLWDYKRTSAWSVLRGAKLDWEQQLNLYRLGLEALDKLVEHLKLMCELRDWSRSRVSGDYPKTPVIAIDVPLWSLGRAEAFLEERVALHTAETPRPCTDEERWYSGTSYAVMKKGRKSALRVLDTEVEAKQWMVQQGKGEHIEKRPGEYRRCENYCPVAAFCLQWKATKRAA